MSAGAERRSISGIRGTAETLPAEKVEKYTRAYATLLRELNCGNTVVLGYDTRPTSKFLAEAAAQALNGAGWDVIDVGVVPTPTVQVAVAKFEAAGGVVITASHNPIEYNGVKFLRNTEGQGMFLPKEQVQRLFDIYEAGTFDERRPGHTRPVAEFAADFDIPPYTLEYLDRHRLGIEAPNHLILDYHLHRLIEGMGRELDRIRGMNFRVAMDCCGGAGIPINFVLLDYLYCAVERINDVPGKFIRPIEPTPRNLAALCEQLAQAPEPFDVGFVTDCDNDRCVLIGRQDGAYAPLEEDYTFGIAVDQVLASRGKGCTVVTNWSTSQMLEDIAEAHHANLRRAPTGEVYTATEANHYGAAIAGEGSCAGVIDPRVGPGRDVLVAMWHCLSALARKQRPLSEVIAGLPHYVKVNRDHPSNLTVEENQALLEKLQTYFSSRENLRFLNREDGVIVYFNDRRRIQIRASNTEPILRVRSEASTDAQASALVQEAFDALGMEG